MVSIPTLLTNYQDGTSGIISPSTPEAGDRVQIAVNSNGQSITRRIEKILETRPSKGQFTNEEDRPLWSKVLLAA